MTMPHFDNDPLAPGEYIWREATPSSMLFVGVCGSIGTLIFSFIFVSAIVNHDFRSIWGLCVMIFGLVILYISTLYSWRNFLGHKDMSIVLTSSEVILHLPKYRSMIHRPPACRDIVRLADVSTIETRLEVYGSIMQRPYRLGLRGKPAIFLFEDRAIGTDRASPTLRGLAEEIAQRAQVTVTDLGTVEGRTWIVAVLFPSPPPW